MHCRFQLLNKSHDFDWSHFLSNLGEMKLLLLTVVLFAGHVCSDTPKQPNIVMILADDMGYQDVGFRGSNILTPNMDKLAKEGVILENHYVMPQCSPTRASLLSGRHAIRTGFWKGNIKPTEEWGLRLNETTIPEMLRRNGYETHGIGKWHCGLYTWEHTPANRGFDTYFGLYLGAQGYFSHKRSGKVDLRDNYHDKDGNLVDDVKFDLAGKYSTYLFTDRAVESIENRDKSKPLFLYLSYTAPHSPNDAPPDAVEKYASHIPADPKHRKKYATQISVMDEGIGKVVETLKKENMLDNTIIVFTADNGAVFGNKGSNYPLRGGKQSLFEGGVRAVSFVSSPLLNKTGYTNTNLHHVTDWYATFQKMAGDQPEHHKKSQLPIDGVDIWESVSNDKPCRDEVLMNFRDHSMIQDSTGPEFLVKREVMDEEEELGELDLGDDEYLDDESSDFFVIRWKDWKLFTGTYKVQDWTSKNSLGHKAKFDRSDDGLLGGGKSGSGTKLFDLSTDPREETDVADKHPDIVKIILDKIPGYKKKMTKINKRTRSKAGMKDGKWVPWVPNSA